MACLSPSVHVSGSTAPALPAGQFWRHMVCGFAVLVAGLVWHGGARAQGADIFKGADLKHGEQLIAEFKCAQCHAQKVGGDGSAIYRPQGRINTAGLLRGMVEQCNTSLNLQMFPEDVTAVAAVLNRDHYKFK